MSDLIKHTRKLWERRSTQDSHLLFWCPACKRGHSFQTPRWTFDNKVDLPTFTPSLLLYYVDPEDVDKKRVTVCHLHVTNGQLQYCNDNPHSFNARTVPMEEIPENYGF